MDRSQIEALLNEVHAGSTSVDDALERLRNLPFEDLGFAKSIIIAHCGPACRR